ncbi:LON peptidase substrate-binding domain-containing protein [Rhodospirillum centenum]|uniref:ATP-dependent protease La domain protein LonD n=1 Tax=Rhodospirillum centenum (strain ATCC 51521 / SW) TaxID=414684 RepID=B6IUQ5_RHOCS|nr:LON peptidase substrate-binding domain-containing protein [Rhodospirillum centenum]ACI99880.1 ATP-dependent protease La domain protein LonD [Rhodospirillum centenum SW]
MTLNPFDPTFESLPQSIPVFPLTGVLLLPRGKLPLNIFEPRYLAMMQDALAADRMIGMIQPADPADRCRNPGLLDVGCAGRITSFSETEDGRFLVTLTGVCRFLVTEEVPTTRGYRRVVPDWSPFALDLTEDACQCIDRPRLTSALRTFFQQHGMQANWDAIESTPDERLVTTLSMICPFGPREKQALLEVADLPQRADMLLALIEMAVHDRRDGEAARH